MNAQRRFVTRLACIVVLVPMTAESQQPTACSASPYRQFDFWLGDWEVTNPEGTVVGTNTIRKILNGCVLHEQWRAADGGSGQSHNIYNLQTGKWHQSWVDDNGQLLLLDGGLDDQGRMVLRGETVSEEGATVIDEIAWERADGNRVRQVWRKSTDGGTDWQVVFNGLYTKVR